MIHVVAGAVIDAAGRVLIAQRPPGKHLAGWWEFPGGKVEAGERPLDALARELHEELAITVCGPPRPLMRLRHAYSHGEVLLEMWVVARFDGTPRGMDGQAIQWCTQPDLEALAELLPADRPVARALRLPEKLQEATTSDLKVYRALPDGTTSADSVRMDRLKGVFCERVRETLLAGQTNGIRGADFLVLSEQLEPDELRKICGLVDVPVYAYGISLESAMALGATGVSTLVGDCIESFGVEC